MRNGFSPTSSIFAVAQLQRTSSLSSLRRQRQCVIMNRIERLQSHLSGAPPPGHSAMQPRQQQFFLAPREATLAPEVYEAVLTADAVDFVARVATRFAKDVSELHGDRQARRLRAELDPEAAFPKFLDATRSIREDASWSIDPVPAVLQDRRVDIGDVAPCDKKFLLDAINSGAQGVQIDFDDGNCPTWKNTLQGHHNIMEAARGELKCGSVNMAKQQALLLVRPRAWNMDETNMIVNGQVVPGAIFDFALHLFHNGKRLLEQGRGPFVFLPKLEGYKEAGLWRKIFEFTERELQLPFGSIKSIVLIENIYAAFEMDEILYELKHHSAGLNCGMWDYTASIVVNFRRHNKCVLPDRQRFVSMKSPFLQHYMELLIKTCKKRKAPATTGMVPFVLDQLPVTLTKATAIAKAKDGKRFEASTGSDGALVYDLALVKPIQEVFDQEKHSVVPDSKPIDEKFYERILMTLPDGEVTIDSVRLNLTVALSYVLGWFQGQGTVVVNGCVEDSATAEISRAQLWQWIYHAVRLHGDGSTSPPTIVTAALVHEMLFEIAREVLAKPSPPPMRHVVAGINLVFRVVTTRSPPPFMTTFLLEQEPLTKSLEE